MMKFQKLSEMVALCFHGHVIALPTGRASDPVIHSSNSGFRAKAHAQDFNMVKATTSNIFEMMIHFFMQCET
jgi:hypothetical protein